MSSILKALRKLEEEKAAAGEGNVDIAHDILKGSARRPPRNFFWPLVSLVLFALVVGGGLYIWSALPQSAPSPAETATHLSPPQVAPLAPAAVQLPTAPRADAPVAVKPAVQVKQVTAAPATAAMPPPAPVKKSVAPAETSAFDADGLPFLILSGIAYRENPAERIAIINDLPVMQGTAIEGAEVEEILADRVILKWRGKRVEKRLAAKP